MSENLEEEQSHRQTFLNAGGGGAGRGGVASLARRLVVGAGARLAVVRATAARVPKVSGAAFVTAGPLGVVLAALGGDSSLSAS